MVSSLDKATTHLVKQALYVRLNRITSENSQLHCNGIVELRSYRF
jgi:hypothetical protein